MVSLPIFFPALEVGGFGIQYPKIMICRTLDDSMLFNCVFYLKFPLTECKICIDRAFKVLRNFLCKKPYLLSSNPNENCVDARKTSDLFSLIPDIRNQHSSTVSVYLWHTTNKHLVRQQLITYAHTK